MMQYPHLAARIFNTPLLVHPGKLDAMIAGMGERLVGERLALNFDAVETPPAEAFSTRRGERHDEGYMVTDGVAVIHASGALVHRSRFDMADCTYFQGYNELSRKLESAMSDPAVHAVLQVFDSPGGEVAGAFEYADRVMSMRGQKPMWAIADTLAASAAYLGGSAFEQLAVSQTGYVGSIGVVMRHVDFSRRLANEGIRVTHIFAGTHKVDGNAYEPLPREVQARLQDEVDALYDLFVGAVAKHTGLSAAAVRDTQAETFRGQVGVDLGLAHRVATTDQLISELAALRARSFPAGQTARSTANDKGASMSGTTQGGQPAAATTAAPAGAAFTQADLDAARAAGLAQGRTDGAAAERDRIAAVRAQSLPGHEALIDTLAADGKTTGPEAAAAVLAAERSLRETQARAEVNDAPSPAKAAAATDADKPAKRAPNISAAYNALNRRPAA